MLSKERISRIFPNCQMDEPPFDERLVYKIPQNDVTSLAECFGLLEILKTEGRVVEYAFSQTTLEQVFLLFAREQDEVEEAEDDANKEHVEHF